MLLNEIVEVSDQLKAIRSRTAKIGAIARLLQGRTAHEFRTIVAWMSGDLLRGRIGISTGRAHQYGQHSSCQASRSRMWTAPSLRCRRPRGRPDHLLRLAPVDPAPLVETVDQIIDEQGIQLEYINRFGRRR